MARCLSCALLLLADAPRCPRCGTSTAGAGAKTLVDGRYAIEAELGHGGMGVVYLAHDVGLGRRVALKFLNPEVGRDDASLERFRREASALASIRHENVVQVYAFGRHDEAMFFAMEYVAGKNLEDIVAGYTENGAFVPARLALMTLDRVACGLDAVHAVGLVHRDVKPANVVIEDGSGRPVLLDLGLARPLLGQRTTRASEVVGSPPYMAPEQIRITPSPPGLERAIDVYALGCTTYEVLTGHPPFVADGLYDTLHLHMTAPPPAVSAVRPELYELDAVLARAMAKDAAARFPSCGAFATAMRAAAAALFEEVRPSVPSVTRTRMEGGVRVLVVDDDEAVRGVIARAVARAFPASRVEVAFADSGEHAIERVREMPPDLITLDYDMPGMNGVETLGILRAQPGVERTPTIVLTGHPEERIRWRFELLGVTELLSKPFELSVLVGSLQRALGGRAGDSIAPLSDRKTERAAG